MNARATSVRAAIGLTAALVVAAWAHDPAMATPTASLQFTSSGVLGNISTHLYDSGPWYLNTDDGNLYANHGQGIQWAGNLSSYTVPQLNGPAVRVWDFAGFNLNPNISLTITGSLPGVIAATGDINIAGNLTVRAGASGGGFGGQGGGTPGGGSSGGGGFFSDGQAGAPGVPQPVYVNGVYSGVTAQAGGGVGGAHTTDLTILHGGSGGGGDWCCSPGLYGGAAGGVGGGAALFATPGNFTVAASGVISANGTAGARPITRPALVAAARAAI